MAAPAGDPAVTRAAWWLDEGGRVGRENLDAAHVAHYDAKDDGFFARYPLMAA